MLFIVIFHDYIEARLLLISAGRLGEKIFNEAYGSFAQP